MYTGPNLTNEDLVFGYDTGYGVADNSTSTRFYPGEPTTNLYTNSDFSNGETGWTFSSWDGNISHAATTVEGPYGETVSANKLTVNSNSSYSHFHQYNQSKYASGSTYTTSAWVKGNGVFQIKSHWGGNASLTLTGEWQRISQTVTATSSHSYHFPYLAGESLTVGTDCYVTMCQTELKDSATPYVYSGATTGSRTNTQALIDLKKTANIDVSNVSFDSTGQPEFDGTDDSILTPFTRATLGDQLTMIAYYKFDGSTGRTYTPIFGGKESGAGTEFFIGKNSGNTSIGVQDGNYIGGFVTGSNAWDGNYHQIVYTYNNGSGKIYLDGVLKNTGSFTKCNGAEQITVGSEVEGSGYYMIGDIPRVRIFDRVFTAQEVLEDLNAYKNRFNI
jgi:hypothetical protein